MSDLESLKVRSNVSKEKRVSVSKVIITLIFLIICILFVFPFIFMISSSFKLNAFIFEFPFRLIPKPVNLEGYKTLFGNGDLFIRWYINTIMIVLITLVLKAIIVGMAAYSLACLKYKGRDVLLAIFIGSLMITGEVVMFSRYIVFYTLKLNGTFIPVIVLYVIDIYILLLLRQFFLYVPKELSESAIIDGCSHFRIFFSIIIPLSKPAYMTMTILTFAWQWNDWFTPFLYVSDMKQQTLAVGIQTFSTEHIVDYATQMAGATILAVPVIIVFLLSQKSFTEGIATSGIKG